MSISKMKNCTYVVGKAILNKEKIYTYSNTAYLRRNFEKIRKHRFNTLKITNSDHTVHRTFYIYTILNCNV